MPQSEEIKTTLSLQHDDQHNRQRDNDRPDDRVHDQDGLRQAASEDELHVSLSLPDHVADELEKWVEKQDWPEGFEPTPKDEYHITLLYAPEGHEEHRDEDWIREAEGYWVETIGLDLFGDDAVVLRVESPDVEQHADDLQDMAENREIPISRFPGGYKPHITLGYGKKPDYLHAPKLKFRTRPSEISTPRESSWDVERPDTLTVLASIFRDPAPEYPTEVQKIGSSLVHWWEPNPGEAIIMAFGGTVDDKAFAEQYAKVQLEAYGYKRVSFDVEPEHKTAGWNEIMAKAKRLIQSGNVTLLRNGYNVIAGHVVGDHGEYNVEIGRDDPSSRAITTWTCECPWDQYAWQRTRQWKKYEGRPCSHVMALYWTSLSTPLDEDISPNQPQQPPAPVGVGGPPSGGSPGLAPTPPSGPPVPGVPMPPSPMQQQGDQIMGQPGPQAPLAPPGSADILPPSPMEQLQMLQPPMPGTTPGGMPAPPGSVSVPGARPPSPFNPIQYPGGTYSKTAAEEFMNGDVVRAKTELYGVNEGREGATDAGQYQAVTPGCRGEVLGQDPTTGFVDVIFPLNGGPMTSYHVRCYVEPNEIVKVDGKTPFIGQR